MTKARRRHRITLAHRAARIRNAGSRTRIGSVIGVACIIGHRMPLERVQEALELTDSAMKMVTAPNGEAA